MGIAVGIVLQIAVGIVLEIAAWVLNRGAGVGAVDPAVDSAVESRGVGVASVDSC